MDNRDKKKLSIWWFLTIPGIFLLAFIGQMFGPNPAIQVSPQTTVINGPIGPDGAPLYKEYLNARMADGVTPENNAAVLYWRATWPGELNPANEGIMAETLGMSVPNAAESLTEIYTPIIKDRGVTWVKQQLGVEEKQTSDEFDFDSEAMEIFDEITSMTQRQPWTSEQIPPLATWVKENQQPMDWAVEGSTRTHYYSPPPNMVDGSDSSLIEMLLPGAQKLRSLARALTSRAMWHAGEGRIEEAWRDLKACHRMARHGAQGFTLVEQLIGIAVNAIATDATHSLLHYGDLSPAQAEMILKELRELPPMPPIAESMNEGERMAFLDITTRLATGKWNMNDFQAMLGSGESHSAFGYVTATRIDWNLVMRRGNDWYDRLVEAARLPRHERDGALQKLNDELAQLSPTGEPAALAGSLVSSKARSEVISDVLLTLFLPAVSAVVEAGDRHEALHRLAITAAALSLYRAKHGAYPEKLEQLVPGCVEELETDVFSGKPFIYRKQGEGFCLYSVFRNGVDDGGTDMSGHIENGQWLDERKTGIGFDESDIVVLQPRPKFPTVKELDEKLD